MQQLGQRRCLLGVKHDAQLDIRTLARSHPQYLEAADVRTEQEHAALRLNPRG